MPANLGEIKPGESLTVGYEVGGSGRANILLKAGAAYHWGREVKVEGMPDGLAVTILDTDQTAMRGRPHRQADRRFDRRAGGSPRSASGI